MIAIFFKAIRRGDDRTGDLLGLIPTVVPVHGYTDKHGVYHAPTQAVRHIRHADWHGPAARRGFNVLADRIDADFQEKGASLLLGQEIRSGADLAALGQVLRNPRYETLRYIFTKAGKVVGVISVSQRQIDSTSAFPQGSENGGGPEWVRSMVAGYGADGVWMLHNHPSGVPTPSMADIRVTNYVAEKVPQLRGHVVINHGKYGYIGIGKGNEVELHDVPEEAIGKKPDPSVAHEILGAAVTSPNALAAVAARVARSGERVYIIGADTQLAVRAVMDVSPLTLKNKVKAAAVLSHFKKRTGSLSVFAVNVPPDLEKEAAEAMRGGLLRDAVVNGKLISERTMYGGGKPKHTPMIMVREDR